jgi:hypothetical protein
VNDNYTYTRTEVHEWTFPLTEEPMDLEALAALVQEAWGERAKDDATRGTWQIEERNYQEHLVIRIEYARENENVELEAEL